MNSADLVRMANQITDFFEVYPKSEALDGIAKHIHNMWEPRMRNELRDAASLLGLAEETIRSRLKKAETKLGVHDRSHAIAQALRLHLIA